VVRPERRETQRQERHWGKRARPVGMLGKPHSDIPLHGWSAIGGSAAGDHLDAGEHVLTGDEILLYRQFTYHVEIK